MVRDASLAWLALLLTLSTLLNSAAADPPPEQVVICSWNLEWFFDNYDGDNYADLAKKMKAPSREDWDWKPASRKSSARSNRRFSVCRKSKISGCCFI